VDAVASTARSADLEPIVVVGTPNLLPPPGVRLVVNPDAAGEQIQSLRLGLAQLVNSPVGGAVIWPVDHPFAELASVLGIVDAARRTRAPIVIPVFEGRRGHPVYFSRDIWRELMTVTDGGARAVVRAHAAAVHEVAVEAPGVGRDIDTRADLAAGGARRDALS
jgi:molybdenum cofactor cytidylyltransferase